jgi:hypothetical protein
MDKYAEWVHVVGTDDEFVLPNPASSRPRNFPFDLVDLDPSRFAVVMFMIKTQGAVWLELRFNDHEPAISFDFDPSDSQSVRSFHEVLPAAHLKEGRNQLFIQAGSPGDGSGRLRISDVVLHYHAKA